MKKLMLVPTLMVLATTAFAAVPSQMNVQGRLLNSGSPMTGTHSAIFAIYDASTAGNLLWTESSTLDVQGGIFTAILGNVTPVPTIVFDSSPRWLEVVVDGNTLTPRLQLTTNAYAFRAQHADTANFALNAATTGDNLWSTNGTDVWRENGKVGIGTNTPNQTLGLNGMFGVYPRPWVQPTTKGTFMYHQNNTGSMYAYDYPAGHGDTLAFSAASIGFDTYGANGLYAGNKMWLSQDGNLGIGTTNPQMKLDIRTKDSEEPLRWRVDSGPFLGSYVKFINNNARGGIAFGNPNPWGGPEPADNAAILHTTGGWQWTKQLNIMGTVGVGTNSPLERLHVSGGGILLDNGQALMFRNIGNNGNVPVVTFNSGDNTTLWGGNTTYFSLINGGASMSLDRNLGLTVNGNLNVSGTKCRVVETTFGSIKMNAVESGHALFMDDQPSARLVDGKCRVNLSPKFLATVTVNGQYPLMVNVTFYGPHGDWYVERDATGFTVIDPSGSNAEISWQAIARQKKYEDTHLDSVDIQTAKK